MVLLRSYTLERDECFGVVSSGHSLKSWQELQLPQLPAAEVDWAEAGSKAGVRDAIDPRAVDDVLEWLILWREDT